MSKVGVLDLIAEYSYGLADAAPVAAYYDDSMWDAAGWGVSTVAVLVPAVKDTATYAMPEIEGRIYAIFYDDILLSMSSMLDLQAVNANWRDERGRPRAFLSEEEPEHEIRVYPVPDENSQDFVFLFGSPFGHDFPARAIGALIADKRDEMPDWLDLPLALLILGREYERDSAHRDAAFAQACHAVGSALKSMVLP